MCFAMYFPDAVSSPKTRRQSLFPCQMGKLPSSNYGSSRKHTNADTAVFTGWLNKLHKVEGHIASLKLIQARPTLLPSVGRVRESPIRRRHNLAQLGNRAEAVAGRLNTLDSSSTLLGTRILDIQAACIRIHKVGAQDGSPLQCYRSIEESTTAMWVALAVCSIAVIEHSLPGDIAPFFCSPVTVCAYTYTCVCIYIYDCIYTQTHRHTQTDTYSDIDIDIDTDADTDTDTNCIDIGFKDMGWLRLVGSLK